MKLSQSYFYTMRENAKDEESISGNLLVRSGMIKKSSNGIYMIMPLGKRVLSKIEKIVRQEINATGAQELLMPALIPEDVYELSGRRNAFGSNMFTLKDRYQKAYALGPTHEELFVYAAMMDGHSYKDFPYSLYQIQTKFRDETRPRYGLIRVREFLMKDAYSFDKDEAGLDISYQKMFDAYQRIFDRMQLNYRIVKADTGNMGGSLSEEFQAISNIGEDTIVMCDACGFASNIEVSEVVEKEHPKPETVLPKELVETKNVKTIVEVAQFFGKDEQALVKTLIYKIDGELYACLIRGDRELNEVKLKKLLQASHMELANSEEVMEATQASIGFIGPIGINCKIVMDREVSHMYDFIVGANQDDYHYIHVNTTDFKADYISDIVNIKEGDECPSCHQRVTFESGIEIGNTFKLGTKYTNSLHLNYLDENNQLQPVVMGSYGIGLERCMAAIVEQHHDEAGIIWPLSVAPYQVAIVIVNIKDEEQCQVARSLYEQLCKEGVEVLLDDRNERVGVKFKDMELIGIPYRITVGKGISDGHVEFVSRSMKEKEDIKMDEIVKVLQSQL